MMGYDIIQSMPGQALGAAGKTGYTAKKVGELGAGLKNISPAGNNRYCSIYRLGLSGGNEHGANCFK